MHIFGATALMSCIINNSLEGNGTNLSTLRDTSIAKLVYVNIVSNIIKNPLRDEPLSNFGKYIS